MFYCREKELYDLNKRYQRNDFECIVVYGRRRIGKICIDKIKNRMFYIVAEYYPSLLFFVQIIDKTPKRKYNEKYKNGIVFDNDER